MNDNIPKPRAFKTAWFSKAAQRSCIPEGELCTAFDEILLGQCSDIGGGVFKKRLGKNRHRGILVSKNKRYWIFVFLFAKKDRENITIRELQELRKLADLYGKIEESEIESPMWSAEIAEICHDKKIQK